MRDKIMTNYGHLKINLRKHGGWFLVSVDGHRVLYFLSGFFFSPCNFPNHLGNLRHGLQGQISSDGQLGSTEGDPVGARRRSTLYGHP